MSTQGRGSSRGRGTQRGLARARVEAVASRVQLAKKSWWRLQIKSVV